MTLAEFSGPWFGSWPRPSVHAQFTPSYAFACHYCGTAWAHSLVPGQTFMFWSTCCPLCHGGEHEVPGSLLLDYAIWDDYLPLALWQREVLLHCEYIERLENAAHPCN